MFGPMPFWAASANISPAAGACPLPFWVKAEARYLGEAWFVPDRPGLRGYLLAASPVAFRTRLIFTGPDPLQRARFPYGRGTAEFPAASADRRPDRD